MMHAASKGGFKLLRYISVPLIVGAEYGSQSTWTNPVPGQCVEDGAYVVPPTCVFGMGDHFCSVRSKTHHECQ